MTDHHDLAEMQGVDQRRKIVGVNDGGISSTSRIVIRIVVSAAVGNRPMGLGELAHLVGPISSVAQRPMDENDRPAFAPIHVTQSDAISNIYRSNGRSIFLPFGDNGSMVK